MTILIPISIVGVSPITTYISILILTPALIPPPTSLYLSPLVAITISITIASPPA